MAHALDLLNSLLPGIRDGLRAYLSIYLLLAHHWDLASIGFVMAVGGIGAIVAQAPAGALVDRSTAKRPLVIGAALTITAGSLAMPLRPLGALAATGFILYLFAMPKTAPRK